MLLPMVAIADAVEIDGIYYNLDSETKTAEVTRNPNYYSGSVEIPETVEYESVTYYVTSIGNDVFRWCAGLTSVTIGNNVKRIGDGAFGFCTELTSIIVEKENSVYDSRNECNAIIETETNTLIFGCKDTTIPNSVTSIGNFAFNNCTGLTSITIPNSVTSIGDCVFYYCTDLSSITIPNSLTSIGQQAFGGCSGLTSITIPNSVTTL